MLLNLIYLLLSLAFMGCDGSKESPVSFNSPTGGRDKFTKELHADWDLQKIVSLDSVRNWPAGKKMFVRTAFAGAELEDFEVKFVTVVEDGLPTMPLVMLEASDPRLIALGGVAQGMSGSPVFTEEGTVGALSYGFDLQGAPPFYFMATPIQGMIDGVFSIGNPSLKSVAVKIKKLVPLSIPIAVTGTSAKALKYFSAIAQKHTGNGQSFLLESGSASSGEFNQSFEAGGPLATGLVVGPEVKAAALGTITYMNGNQIFGFGHPVLELGPQSLPIVDAYVIAEISNLFAAFKFFSLGENIRGELTADRLPGVGGVLGQIPNMLPVTVTVDIPNFGIKTFKHSVARGLPAGFETELSAMSVFIPVLNRNDNVANKYSFRVDTKITTDFSDIEIKNSRLYSAYDSPASEVLFGAIDEYFSSHGRLLTNPYQKLQIKDVTVSVKMVDSLLIGMITKIHSDTSVFAGDVLKVGVNLRVNRTEDREVEFNVAIPDTFPVGIYSINVGPKREVRWFMEFNGMSDPVSNALLPDTSMSDMSMDEFLKDVNAEDEKTILGVAVSFVSSPVPDKRDLDTTKFAGLDSLSVRPDSVGLPPNLLGMPDMGITIPDNMVLYQSTGLVLQGSRTMQFRVKSKTE